MNAAISRGLVLVTLLSAIVAGPGPARAGTGLETLQRSLENITQPPLDLVLSGPNAVRRAVLNSQSDESPMPTKVIFAAPGVVLLTGVNVFGSVVRALAGVVELVPGLLDAPMPPLFPTPRDGYSLVDHETSLYHIKFGVDYVGGRKSAR